MARIDRSFSRREWCALLSAALMPASAQDDVIKVDVDLVNLLFTVRNKQGLVGNLNKEEFTVFEDGREQQIRSFTRESNLPLTIGLLIDVSVSQERLIEVEKEAARQFFARVLRDKDLAFLISFGAEAELLQDYTNSQKLLRQSMDGLRVNAAAGGLHAPSTSRTQLRGTIMFDTVFLAADEKLRGQVGRKVLILITDGVDQGSRVSRDKAIEAAQKADTIIYSIQYVDYAFYNRGYYSMGGVSDADLKRMSEQTGGRVFYVDRNNTLLDIFRQIEEEVRTQYSIAYTPANSKKDGTFRKIEIRTRQKELKVQARRGYYAVAAD
jgi:VWFA-related protein